MSSGNATSTSSTAATTPDPNTFCRTTEWYIILAASVGFYFVGMVLLLILTALCNGACSSQNKKGKAKGGSSLLTRAHLQCQALMKGANPVGKILLVLYSLAVIVSFLIYIIMTYQFTDPQPLGSRTLLLCLTAEKLPVAHVEFGLNVFYCVMFVLRLLSSESLLTFWLTIDTLADTLTIIPSFIMYGLDKHLIAFQFARLTGLRFLVNALIYCKLLSSDKYIRLVSLLIQILSIWAVSAGMFQLIEVVGDFWRYDEGATSATFYQYHDCFYFMLITMSTVGYGDFSPKTILGKFFTILFILVALSLFTSIIPEVSDILSENKKYRKNKVHLKSGKKHVVVIANFTPPLLKTFMNDFFHSERDVDEKQFVALLGKSEPDLELKTLMKTRELYVTYLQGSVMNVKDLQRACISEAAAVILLSDSLAKDMEDEDMRNIMRVIAIKDYCPTVQVLVQLQLYRSKTYLRNIPDWCTERGDEAVCINEIKYGILAQSCMVPGLSTLLCNLLMLRSGLSGNLPPLSWEAAYQRGVEYEFYRVPFSTHFHGFTFQQAAEVCIDQLGITLLAAEVLNDGSHRTVINPGSSLRINSDNMRAFVIASDERDAKRLQEFNESSESARKTVVEIRLDDVAVAERQQLHQQENNRPASRSKAVAKRDSCDTGSSSANSADILLDTSGYFYWAPNHQIEDAILDSTVRHQFSGHVIVLILEKGPDVSLNLTSFIMPLRSSSIAPQNIKDIVFVGRISLLKAEWSVIQNFPKVHLLNGSPLNRANLKSVGIESCHSCLILSPKTVNFEPDAQMDRETVLCTLNIKTMKNARTGQPLGDCIHIITELNNEDAIAYLDQDDDAEVDEAYMTQAFATGRTFFLSLLESLVTTIYFNPAALSFLRTIVTTVDSDDFEVDLNEQGFLFLGSDHIHVANGSSPSVQKQQRSQIELLSVAKGQLAQVFYYKVAISWKEFTLLALRKLQLVCIGLSRLQVDGEGEKNHRFVMTMPHEGIIVKESDMVYCLTPPQNNL